MTKKMKISSLSIISIIAAVALTIYFFSNQLLKLSVGSDKTEIVFDVSPGSSLAQISNNLQNKGLIRNSKVFQVYAKIQGHATHLKVGEYSLNATMTPDEIINILVAGKSIARSITIAEGLNIYDIAEIFEKNNISTQDEFFKLISDKVFIKTLLSENINSLEGFLYPETYKVTKFEGLKPVVTQMVNRFLTVWKDVEAEAKNLGWSRLQVITLASIVEKETGASFERPLVASVFHNRLVKKMRLQTDPTVMYGVAIKQGKMPTNITKNDLLTPTAYNTYTNEGLPPAPISNPGKEAIMAVFKPAQTKYLFFVSQNNGTHMFSENLEQHNKAVQTYQMNAKARENKSWRDLKEPKK